MPRSPADEGGLAFPEDLDAWRRWVRWRHPVIETVRAIKDRRSGPVPVAATLGLPTGEATTLVVIDQASPSARAAVHAPLAHLDPATTAVLTLHEDLLPDHLAERQAYGGTGQLPQQIDTVLSLGSFNPLSGEVAAWAKPRGARHVVVQHGLLTRWAPPLADGDHLLAWSDADAAYWSAGRSSITSETVGSQLLALAGRRPKAPLKNERPVLLGQLHGTELTRREALLTYVRLAREADVDYRPHPNERDLASRAAHRLMRRAGLRFAESTGSLLDLHRPVVSIFSTGTLEAAQRGLPAWVVHAAPPPWIEDLWERYALSRWGADPTPAWPAPSTEPAAAVAARLNDPDG